MEELEERHQVEIKVYKQKVKHLLYEHQNNISHLKEESEVRGWSNSRSNFNECLPQIGSDSSHARTSLSRTRPLSRSHCFRAALVETPV